MRLLEENQQKGLDIHDRSIVITTHDHLQEMEDLEASRQGGITAKILHSTVDALVWSKEEIYRWSLEATEGFTKRSLEAIDRILGKIDKYQGKYLLVQKTSDILAAKQSGKLGIILGLEGAKPLEGSLEVLHCLYRLGVRHVQLTWACSNQLIDRSAGANPGLTNFGKRVVEEMNKLGMICDVSHLPNRAYREVLEISKDPVIDSHCSVRAYSSAGLSDNEIKGIAEKGGLLGLHFCSHYVREGKSPATIDDLIDEIDYIAQLVGIEYVGIGPDYFLHNENYRRNTNQYNLSWVKDLETPGKMTNLAIGLVGRGYSKEHICKLLGGNMLRVLKVIFHE